IPLVVGGQNRRADFESDSESNTLTFAYQVVEGDEDTDGASMGVTIVLDGGEIRYTDSGEEANLSLCGNMEEETVIDGVEPKLTEISIASDNAKSTLAKPGDEIRLTFVADEPIDVPTVTLAGQPATVNALDNEVPNSWQATYVMTADDGEGPIAFTVNYIDAAGNAGEAAIATTDESSVTFDKTAPETPSLQAIERGDGELVISWKTNTEIDFALYRLYMGTDEETLDESIDIAGVATDSYTHGDLVNGTAYHYRIAAVDEAG